MAEELDYKQMFETLFAKFKDVFKVENEYFELLGKVQETKKYNDLLNEHLFEVSIADQLPICKLALAMNEYGKQLCEKYGWED